MIPADLTLFIARLDDAGFRRVVLVVLLVAGLALIVPMPVFR